MSGQLEILETLVDRVTSGSPCALCTVVGTRGSTPQTAGAMLLVLPDGQAEGTVGGGCVEAEVRRRALAMLSSGASGLVRLVLDHDYGWDDGLICGGRLDVAVVCPTDASEATPFREAADRIRRQQTAQLVLRVLDEGKRVEYRLNIEPTPTLLVAGAGHVGAAVAKLAVSLGFRVVVVDDRSDLLNDRRLPPPVEKVAGDIQTTLLEWPVDANTYVVVLTRGHAHDEQALHAVIDSPARYIGMIGSRRKIRIIFDDLEALGVSRASLDRVHTPIGLSIGAVTVSEIAVSVAAELIQVRRAEAVKAVDGPFEVESDGS
ncbi:MAG: XdhC family protein [Planctomycetota bacterium]|jgi:xanthine dehydrogenase accessory factor